MESGAAEKGFGALTPQIRVLRLGLLNHAMVVGMIWEPARGGKLPWGGVFRSCIRICARRTGGEREFAMKMDILEPRGEAIAEGSKRRSGRAGMDMDCEDAPGRWRAGRGVRFRDLRTVVMRYNTRPEPAIPHWDGRDLSCRVWLTPRQGAKNSARATQERRWRSLDGSARTVEGLRRMRMSLVPE